jgi:hypothetical protein
MALTGRSTIDSALPFPMGDSGQKARSDPGTAFGGP